LLRGTGVKGDTGVSRTSEFPTEHRIRNKIPAFWIWVSEYFK